MRTDVILREKMKKIVHENSDVEKNIMKSLLNFRLSKVGIVETDNRSIGYEERSRKNDKNHKKTNKVVNKYNKTTKIDKIKAYRERRALKIIEGICTEYYI